MGIPVTLMGHSLHTQLFWLRQDVDPGSWANTWTDRLKHVTEEQWYQSTNSKSRVR